jgi:hypothetical protein
MSSAWPSAMLAVWELVKAIRPGFLILFYNSTVTDSKFAQVFN